MAYKINGTTVVDNSRNVCACCVTSCCITASTRMDVPSGNTASRPASPATGSIYFDTDLGSLISYDGTAWAAVGGGSGLDLEEIVTSDADAWAFIAPSAQCACRTYNPQCHGYACYKHGDLKDYSLYSVATDTPCFHTLLAFQNYGNGSCAVQLYCRDSQQYICCVECGEYTKCVTALPCRTNNCCIGMIVGLEPNCNASLNTRFNVKGHFPIQVGPDGSVRIFAVDRCVQTGTNHCLVGANCWYHMGEYFVNTKGGVSLNENTSPWACALNICKCTRVPFGYIATPRIAGKTRDGWLAYFRGRIHFRDDIGSSPNMCCPVNIPILSSTYGTGLEEACDYFFITKPGPGVPYFNAPMFPVLTTGLCYCYNTSTQLCDTVYNCCMANQIPFKSTINGLVGCNEFSFYNSRTDIPMGGSAYNINNYDLCICCYSDGVCNAAFSVGCCAFAIQRLVGHIGVCCICFSNFAQDSQGLMFPSRDGCYLHRIFICQQTCASTSVCSCKRSTSSSGANNCWGRFDRLYQTKIDRLNQCVVQHKGFCGVDKLAWECNVLGCSALSEPRQTWVSEYPQLLCSIGAAIDPNRDHTDLTTYMRFNHSGSNYTCLRTMPLEEQHHVIWSKVCSNRGFLFYDNCCGEMGYSVFDCNKDQLDFTYNFCRSLGVHPNNPVARHLVDLFGTPPVCMSTSCVGCFACFFGGCSSGWTAYRECLCAVTGNCSVPLTAKCLGYKLYFGGCSCMYKFVPPGTGSQFSMVHNRYNDHLVFFRAIGCSISSSENYPSEISWIGAICWDLHNQCVSKVNTFWPPPLDILQYQCKAYYDMHQCAIACSTCYFTLCSPTHKPQGCGYGGCFCECHRPCNQGVKVIPYGNYKTWIDSGCTDYGGLVISSHLGGAGSCHGNLNNLQIRRDTTCCNYFCYYYCTAVASTDPCIRSCNSNLIMNIVPEAAMVARVPFTKPLECIGWRSEPDFAKMFNAVISPQCCACYFTNLMTYGGTEHQCITRLANCMNFKVGECQTCQALTCWTCGPYGSVDCMRWHYTLKIVTSNCCLFSNCCFVTGQSNGTWCPVPLSCYYAYLTTCARTHNCAQVYKCVQPCHLNKSETSKLYIHPYIESDAPVVAHNYSRNNRADGRYIPLATGEHPREWFHRFWNECIICCC